MNNYTKTGALAVAVAVAATLAEPTVAQACLWDNDTWKEESLGDRDVAAIVVGDLGKHTRQFYEEKVHYTRAIIERGRAPAERYDDLAVALAKIGKVDEALSVLSEKEKRFPGAYTTHANRGTFLGTKGDLAGALSELRKAVEINPNAHFGREIVQIRFIEWLSQLASDPKLVRKQTFLGQSVRADEEPQKVRTRRLSRRARTSLSPPVQDELAALDTNIVALVGMIRFGDGETNQHLWFALAHNLAERGDNQLAIHAYRQAERLGHPLALGQGGVRASMLRDFTSKDGPTLDPKAAGSVLAWAKAKPALDAAWAAGSEKLARRQKVEERKLAQRRYRQLFGY